MGFSRAGGSFKNRSGKLLRSSTVQKAECRRFEESKRSRLKNQSQGEEEGRSCRAREEREGVKPELIKISIITTLIDAAECHM